MKLVVMTEPTFFVEEDKILTTLFEEGMKDLHICKPGASPLYTERLLSLIPEEYHSYITVHDHYYLKREYDLAGIHIDDMEKDAPHDYKGYISRTCTKLGDLRTAKKKKCRYVFLKNIFDSFESVCEKASFNISELEAASAKGIIDRHVFAMGGITLDNLKIVKELGFGGAVVCGDIWKYFDIHTEADYTELINHYMRLADAVQ